MCLPPVVSDRNLLFQWSIFRLVFSVSFTQGNSYLRIAKREAARIGRNGGANPRRFWRLGLCAQCDRRREREDAATTSREVQHEGLEDLIGQSELGCARKYGLFLSSQNQNISKYLTRNHSTLPPYSMCSNLTFSAHSKYELMKHSYPSTHFSASFPGADASPQLGCSKWH